ncbi:MAG: ABC transporter ATP-binding protein [Kiritimatiellae bacterium]|jgi:ATP-binding cassette subfamily B protein|nr:ABC transporter ATP-binding protein [Kiritimatiellia bacterium]
MKSRLTNITATLSRAIRLIWLSSPVLALWHALLTIIQATLPLISLIATGQIINHAKNLYGKGDLAGLSLSTAADLYAENPEFRTLVLWSLLLASCIIITAFLKIAIAWISEFHSIAVTDTVYKKMHQTLIKADYAFFENSDDQNDLYMAREQAISRPVRIISGLNQLIHSFTGLAGALAILFSLAPLLPLILCISVIPNLYFKFKRSRRFFEWRKNLIPLERKAAYFHTIMTGNEGAKEIRLYGHGELCQKRFQHARDKLKAQRAAWRKFVLAYDASALIVGFIVISGALFILLDKTLQGAISVGSLYICIQAIRRSQSVISVISSSVASLLEDSMFLQSYEELINRTPLIKKPAAPEPVPHPLKTGIVFENVSFSYQGTATPALSNISLTLNNNERIALAGSNGAGKSTLIKLLCRLYDPTEGRILVDGTDLRDFDPDLWRKQIGVLFQDFNSYQFSVADNIRIGHPAFNAEDPAIKTAADDAGLTLFIKKWPHGLRTLLGRWLHNGIEPSTGQWQKIALARAFLRPASLYLLDEPTSALDGAAQRETLSSLAKLSKGKLTIFTSHRTLPVGLADRVILLSDGSVAADGTPDQLNTSTEFKKLFEDA